MISRVVKFDMITPFQNNIFNIFLLYCKGLDPKGQPLSPTKCKAEQAEDLQDDAEGRWSDHFSELLLNFTSWGKGWCWALEGKKMEYFYLRMLFAHTWKVPSGLGHETLILLRCISSQGRFRFTNAIFTDYCWYKMEKCCCFMSNLFWLHIINNIKCSVARCLRHSHCLSCSSKSTTHSNTQNNKILSFLLYKWILLCPFLLHLRHSWIQTLCVVLHISMVRSHRCLPLCLCCSEKCFPAFESFWAQSTSI